MLTMNAATPQQIAEAAEWLQRNPALFTPDEAERAAAACELLLREASEMRETLNEDFGPFYRVAMHR